MSNVEKLTEEGCIKKLRSETCLLVTERMVLFVRLKGFGEICSV